MIHAKDIYKSYGSGDHKVRALNKLVFEVGEGEHVAIVGRSGSGKTTLLNILSGLDTPTGGELIVDGKNLGKLTPTELADYRLNSVSVIFQSFQLIPQRTAAQNVELPLLIAGKKKQERLTLVNEALEQVGLTDRAKHHPYQLSGGEQQRVAIARAMVKRPSVLFADEPTGNLDSANATAIMGMLVDVARRNQFTLVLVTHDLELAFRYSDRQFLMEDGEISETDLRSPETAGGSP